ncbi:MAG: TraR/DksA C4-type zinc finger protein [Acidobacteriota bacterium]
MTASPAKTTAHLSAEDLEALRNKLLEEKERVEQLYRNDLKAGQSSLDEASDDLVDRATSAQSRELNFSLSNTELSLLKEINSALDRIEDGTYGTCQNTGTFIGLPRLQAVPWARYCVSSQELAERGLLDD